MRKVGSRIAVSLTLVAMTWAVSSQPVKRSIRRDARRIQRAAPADATTLATRQRFLEMFARAYFPGRTGQLLIVPRDGDIITRPDPNVTYMHGSPWTYDVAIPLMFAGPAVRTGVYSMSAAQQDVAPTLADALGVQMPPTATGCALPVLRRGSALSASGHAARPGWNAPVRLPPIPGKHCRGQAAAAQGALTSCARFSTILASFSR